ncbi:MAG TPA: glycerol-3-phosphate dehydrogenase C-terminal domain-containing protein, partial [Longimicrobiaceae bacterium]|nr:glycerol-3-phosphate dehydrogenase C-terminal domain-containing protein [Longimicrobiaceae bacterium]
SASATSREHAIWCDPSGLLNVAGGKLTTFRSMAAEVVDSAAAILRDEFGRESGDCHTEYLAVPGAPDSGAPPASEGMEDHLDRRYGADASQVRLLVTQDPSLGAPIVAGRPDLRAEAVHAVRHEMALTLEDVLRRRLHLCYELRDGAMSAAPEVAALIGGMPELGWDTAEIERQLSSYADTVRATRPARG